MQIYLLDVKHAFRLFKLFSFCTLAVYKTELYVLPLLFQQQNFSLHFYEKESFRVKERWTTDKFGLAIVLQMTRTQL